MSEPLSVEWLGQVSYSDALAFQHEAVADRLAGRTSDRLLLLEHPAVITLGRSTDRSNLRDGEARLREIGVRKSLPVCRIRSISRRLKSAVGRLEP